EAYLEILTEPFIKNVAQKLIDVYGKLLPVLQDSPVADPAIVSVLQSLSNDFKFLYDGTLGQQPNRLLNVQYYYDFFSDLFAAYKRHWLEIRIAPSLLGKEFLSQKAIPFYYKVNEGSQPLYLSWSAENTIKGRANKNLSYHALNYITTDESVFSPLNFDLESFN